MYVFEWSVDHHRCLTNNAVNRLYPSWGATKILRTKLSKSTCHTFLILSQTCWHHHTFHRTYSLPNASLMIRLLVFRKPGSSLSRDQSSSRCSVHLHICMTKLVSSLIATSSQRTSSSPRMGVSSSSTLVSPGRRRSLNTRNSMIYGPSNRESSTSKYALGM